MLCGVCVWAAHPCQIIRIPCGRMLTQDGVSAAQVPPANTPPTSVDAPGCDRPICRPRTALAFVGTAASRSNRSASLGQVRGLGTLHVGRKDAVPRVPPSASATEQVDALGAHTIFHQGVSYARDACSFCQPLFHERSSRVPEKAGGRPARGAPYRHNLAPGAPPPPLPVRIAAPLRFAPVSIAA
eukprot:365920-Chlamydomonas_euryale.AAC.7